MYHVFLFSLDLEPVYQGHVTFLFVLPTSLSQPPDLMATLPAWSRGVRHTVIAVAVGEAAAGALLRNEKTTTTLYFGAHKNALKNV